MNNQGKQLKQKIAHEMGLLIIYTIYLTFFFWSFRLYHRLILDEYAISYVRYGYSFVEALILAKIILLGQMFNLGEKRFTKKPLIYPILYKTVVFCIFVFIFTVLEHFVIGMIEGNDFSKIYSKLLSIGIYEIYAEMLIMFFVFVFFFAFLEIGRFLGEGKLIALLFFKKTNDFINTSNKP
jgi:hypothetical protein